MSRKAISEAQRRRLAEAFRESPGGARDAYVSAAERAGCDWRTARRAWEVGWPGLPALREQLAEERVLARAELSRSALAAKAAAAPSLAMEDAAQAMAREAVLARVSREMAYSFFTELAPLRGYVKTLASRLNRPGEVEAMSTEAALEAMRSAAGTISKIMDVAQKAMQVERMVLGAPTEVLGVVPVNEPTITLDTAAAEVAAAQRALARLSRPHPSEDLSGRDDTST